jgi:hypothetical protein
VAMKTLEGEKAEKTYDSDGRNKIKADIYKVDVILRECDTRC